MPCYKVVDFCVTCTHFKIVLYYLYHIVKWLFSYIIGSLDPFPLCVLITSDLQWCRLFVCIKHGVLVIVSLMHDGTS